MEAALRDELLHLIGTARGATTAELWLDIQASRKGKLWPHREPANEAGLRMMLLGLSAVGQVENVPGVGWMLANAVPKEGKRRTFSEREQKLAF